MILSKVYEDAEHRLKRNEITLGEFERLVDIEVIEPKRGEWIRAINNDYDRAYHNYCSLCKEWNGMDVEGWNWTPNYCPNCGARMKGADDGE